MILVTGGTGFVGGALIPQLVQAGKQVRILLRPSPVSPRLPKGVSVEVAVCSLRDERGLRAAMKGVSTVIHLAGVERQSSRANLSEVDVDGSYKVAQAAAQAGVRRIVYLSHLGADRSSAYPVLKAKGLAEHAIIESGVPYTIFRSAILYGPGDQFSTGIARLIRMNPFFFMLPGDGQSLIQPLWIDDLVAAMMIALEDPEMLNKLVHIGGAETLSFRQCVEIVMNRLGVRRVFLPVPPPYLRMLALWVEQPIRRFPLSIFWLDYLSADRTCGLDSLPRAFGLLPARFHQQLDHLPANPEKKGRILQVRG